MDTERIDASRWIQQSIPGVDRCRDAVAPCVPRRELRLNDTTTQLGTVGYIYIGYIHGINTNEGKAQGHVLVWELNKVGKQWERAVAGSKSVVKLKYLNARPGEKQKPQEAPDLGDH